MVSGEQAEKAGQESWGKGKKTEKRNVYPVGGRERKRDWLCSRFFLLAAFLCLFVNQNAEAPGLFPVLLSAGLQAGLLWVVGKWTGMGRDEKKARQRADIFVSVGFAGMLFAQFLLFTQAGGYPEDRKLWIECWGGLPNLGEWIWNHWKVAGAVAVGCVDLSILMAVWFAGKQAHRKGYTGVRVFQVFYLLFLLLGISPWLLVLQPLFFAMPVITGLMLYAGRKLREPQKEIQEEAQGEAQNRSNGRDWFKSDGKKKGCLAGGAAVLLFLLCLLASGLDGAGIRAVFEGKSLPRLLLYWFESLKNGLSDGAFGWLSGPKLTPFTMNGWALRLQNTIYPGADRYGWYAGLAQGTWVLLMWMGAVVPVKKAGKETVFFLIAMLLLPLRQPAGSCMAVAVFLPWLAVRTLKAG